MQPNLMHPTAIHPKRDEFEADYAGKGFLYVMKRYGDMGWRDRLRKTLSGARKTAVKIYKRLFGRYDEDRDTHMPLCREFWCRPADIRPAVVPQESGT